MTFGERMKMLRGDLTQTAFAKKLGLPQNTYHRYEKGERVPDIKALIKIAKSLHMSADDLLGLGAAHYESNGKNHSGRNGTTPDEKDATIARQAESIVNLTRSLKKIVEQKT